MSPPGLRPLLERIRDVLFELERQATAPGRQQWEQLLGLRLSIDRTIEDAKQTS